jgi:hypothetical protein
MRILHLTPGHSAAASLRQALRAAESGDELLPCPEDFSCGPIASLAARNTWWREIVEEPEMTSGSLAQFWQWIDAWNGKLVLWFGRGSAWDLCFLHLIVDRLADRALFAVDVTGLQYPATRWDGTKTICDPTSTVSTVHPGPLQELLGTERELDQEERAALRVHWQVLVHENAPFRIVSETGLVSVQEEHFDQALLDSASTTWRKLARVVGDTLASERARFQVGDLMLLVRAVALVEQGRLLAKGDPWQMRSCEVRIAEAHSTG